MTVAVSLAALAGRAGADIPAFTFPEPTTAVPSGTGTDGFKFTPVVDVTVTALGYYDRGQDGFSDLHPVAIYDFLTKAVLIQAVVGPASTLLVGSFRYEVVPPLKLTANQDYLVAGFTQQCSNCAQQNPPGRVVAAEIGPIAYFYDFGPTLQFPTTDGLSNTFFGPGFLFVLPKPPEDLCKNGVTDGNETDTDCGGGVCPGCEAGRHCTADSDCVSERCDWFASGRRGDFKQGDRSVRGQCVRPFPSWHLWYYDFLWKLRGIWKSGASG